MRPFKYSKTEDAAEAVKMISANANSQFLAGGTNLIDLMKEDVARPDELVDITRVKLAQIKTMNGGVTIGALAKNTDTANHPLIRQNYPLLTQAILAGASRDKSAIWRPTAEISISERAVRIFTIRQCRATNANRIRAAARSKESIECTRFSVGRTIASP